MSESLVVVLYGTVVGVVERASRYADPAFRYDAAYLANGTVPISTRLPLGADTFRGKALGPFLDGLLPENPATRQRWAARLGTDGDDSFSLLSRMGWDCPGAIQFCPPDELDDLRSRDAEMRRVSESDIGDRLRALRDDSASWSLPEEHWSLPGQQDKFTLTLQDGRWHEARGATATTHIIKPGIGRLFHQALVEHATMLAAAMLEVDVAATDFHLFDGEAAIVVQRFDRVRGPDGSVLRLHQEDFCQAAGRLPARKYEAERGPTLKDMVRIVDQQCTDRVKGRRALADFLAINYVVGAPDGHSKNISLALLPGEISVAPLYDVATGFPYDGRPEYRRVALSIGGRRDFGHVLAKHWDNAAETLSLQPGELRTRVLDMSNRFPDAFVTALAKIDDPNSLDVRDRTLDRLAAHCADVRTRLRVPGSRPTTGGPRHANTSTASTRRESAPSRPPPREKATRRTPSER